MSGGISGAKRRPVIAGNWKMYKTIEDTRSFFGALFPQITDVRHCDIVVATPYTSIHAAVEAARGSNIAIGAQDVFWEQEGAYTGEVSAAMLADAGCQYAIIGHSERRQYFGETDENVAKKTKAALASGIRPIVCVGELLEHREGGRAEEVCQQQFTAGLGALTLDEFSRILIAYEPVWAIGTGRTATPEIAAEAHRFLRACAAQRFSESAAANLRILYGGSVKPDNIKGLMAEVEIDGALVGGASLDAKAFSAIVNYA